MAAATVYSRTGSQGSVEALATDLATGFLREQAKANYPRVDWLDGGAPAAAGGDLEINGQDLLQEQTFDTINLDEATGGGELDLYALTPGDSGFIVQVVVGAALDINFDINTKLLVITLPAVGDSDDDIATAINADASDCNGYIRATSGGAGNITEDVAQTAMAGGTGTWANNVVEVAGVACLPANETGATSTAKWSETQITVTVPNLTGETDARAVGDIAALDVKSAGIQAHPVAFALGA